MNAPSEIWSQAATLFDELADRPPDERERIIAERTVPEPVRRWLDELLEAHDTDHSVIIDRRVEDLARGLSRGADVPGGDELVGQRFGPWRADGRLGRGGMGLVLEGSRDDGRFDMRVAIKVLDPDALGDSAQSLIEHEVRTLARLEHPGIARLIDGGVREDGIAWLAMEYVDGEPLDVWADSRFLTTKEKLELFEQVADAVSYCHRELVAHGDIKPGNILVDESGRARLLDFGIAAGMTEASGAAADAPAGRWCSPGYASPERLAGGLPSIADDVFALGAVLFRLLSGHGIRTAPEQTRLIEGRDAEPAEACERVKRQFYNVDLCAIVMHALESDPRQRYQSVEALVSDLARWKQGFPVSAREGSTLYRLECWIGRHTSLAVSGMVVVVALVGGLSLALWQADRAEKSARVAESAQLRAESINRFLLDLFEAEIPDLPPDEMPTTRQLVEQGVERARDPDTGPPELRADLMLNLAGILLSRRQLDEADELVASARELVDIEAHPDLAIRLAMLDVDRARLRNRFEAMEQALETAIDLLERHRPGAIEGLEMQRDLGRLYMRLEQLERADEVLAEVQRAARRRDDAATLQLHVAGDRAVVSGRSGRPRQAIEQFREVLRLKREQPGISPLSLATTVVNIAGLHARLGAYDEAEARYREVLELLEPFDDLPRGERATSLAGLADIRRWRGRFDEAESFVLLAAEEWRRVLNLDSVDADFFIHYYLAELYGDAQRFEAAAERIETAIDRMTAGQEAPPQRVAEARADLARYRCELGQADAARPALAQARSVLEADSPTVLAEAEVVCALSAGQRVDPERIAAERIAKALENPGEVNAIARLEALRADLLSRAGRQAEALEVIESATSRLREKAVEDDHPLLIQLARLRGRIDEPMALADQSG